MRHQVCQELMSQSYNTYGEQSVHISICKGADFNSGSPPAVPFPVRPTEPFLQSLKDMPSLRLAHPLTQSHGDGYSRKQTSMRIAARHADGYIPERGFAGHQSEL